MVDATFGMPFEAVFGAPFSWLTAKKDSYSGFFFEGFYKVVLTSRRDPVIFGSGIMKPQVNSLSRLLLGPE